MKKLICLAVISAATLSADAQLLWKVSGNGAKGESYLFGTHHIAPVTLIDTLEGLNEAICSVDAVAGEIDMSIMADPMKAQAAVMQFGMAPADSTLTNVLTPEQTDSLNTVLGKYTGGQLNARMLDQLKPAIVNTQLAVMQNMEAFPDFDASQQLDTEVQNRARSCNREIIGFETLEEQTSMLFGGSIKSQVKDLMQTVRSDMEGRTITKAKSLAEAYISGNLDALSALIFDKENGMSDEELNRLLIGRNNNWIAQLKALLPEKSLLVCVGCGHLIGPDGLIEQLRKLGYDVTPVNQ